MPLKACGSNGWGQLGLGSLEDESTFKPCQFKDLSPSSIVDLASGSSHTLLIVSSTSPNSPHDSSRNLLLAAGTNTHGQLGPNCVLWNEVRQSPSFRPLDLLSTLRESLSLDSDAWHPIKVACSWSTSFVVYERLPSPSSSDGLGDQLLVVFGSNDFGERAHAPEFGGQISIIERGERVQHLVAGQRHVVAVLVKEGKQRVMGWGGARHGQLGHCLTITPSMSAEEKARLTTPPPPPARGKGKGKEMPRTSTPVEIPVAGRVLQVAVGSAHTLILTEDGLRAFGSDAKGQISGLDGLKDVQQVTASWNGSYVLREGKIHAQGANTHAQLCGAEKNGNVEVPGGRKVKKITAGSEHLVVLLEDGEVLAGGWNEHGNLGIGDERDRDELVGTAVRAERVWAGCATTFIA